MIALLILGMMVGCGDKAESPAQDAAEAAPKEAPAEAAEAPAKEEPAEEAVAELGSDWIHYGEAFTLGKAESASTLLSDPSQYLDKTVRVTGRVADVCQKAACWLVLADEEKLLRVTMKDHAFAVHKRGAGGEADIEGLVVAKAIDPKEVAHFEGESEHPDKIPEAQATGTTTYELVASGVSMRKVAAEL